MFFGLVQLFWDVIGVLFVDVGQLLHNSNALLRRSCAQSTFSFFAQKQQQTALIYFGILVLCSF